MSSRPPRSTRSDTLFPDTQLFRSVRGRDRSSSILAIRTSVSNDMEPDPSVRLLTDWFQPPRVGEGRRGASRSFLSRDGGADLDNRFAEIAAFEHADKRLGRIEIGRAKG